MTRYVCWSRGEGWCGEVHENLHDVARHLADALNKGHLTDRHPYALDAQGRVLGPDDEVLDGIPIQKEA